MNDWKARNERRKRQWARDPEAKADFVRRKRHRTWDKKRALIADAKGTKCSKCGSEPGKENLCFAHRDPSKRRFALADGHRQSFRAIRAELEKCDVVCRKCLNHNSLAAPESVALKGAA